MKLLIVFYLKLGQPQSTKKTTLMERKSRRTFFFQYIFFLMSLMKRCGVMERGVMKQLIRCRGTISTKASDLTILDLFDDIRF